MANILQRVWNRLATDYQKPRYMEVARQVLQTAPLTPGDAPFMTLSMVHQRDVIPYLVAVKSFACHLRPERITIVCDPSIDEEARQIFRQHIPFVELRQAQEFQSEAHPKGGCWERLAAIASYSPEHYVVQLDADTVTVAPLPEVESAIRNRHGFVLGEKENQQLMTLAETEANAHDWSDRHIQSVSEKRMDSAGLSMNLYVRGCAGFTGFPSNGQMAEQMREFSSKMAQVALGRWAEWGTEQVTSNYLVANAEQTRVLPYPRYSTPERNIEDIVFFHFIGYVRYVNSLYRTKTLQVLPQLARAR